MLDLRVEDMILNPMFFSEIVDFAQQMVSLPNPTENLRINPLYRSIGFLESLSFLNDLLA